MTLNTEKLAADVAALKTLVDTTITNTGILQQQLADLKAAKVAGDDTGAQAAIDAIDTTVEQMAASLAPATSPSPAAPTAITDATTTTAGDAGVSATPAG